MMDKAFDTADRLAQLRPAGAVTRRQLGGLVRGGRIPAALLAVGVGGDEAVAACIRPDKACDKKDPKRATGCGGANCKDGRCQYPKGRTV